MAFVPAPNVVRLALIFSLYNEEAVNTFHYHLPAAPDLTKLHDIIQTAETWARAHPGLWSDDVQLTELYALDLTTEGSWTLTRAPDPPIDGTDTGELQPGNVTLAIKRQSGHAGRKNRGRVYWVGITRAGMSDPDHVTGGYATNKVFYLDALKDAQLADNAATEVILHRATGTHVDVASYTVADLALDSQRRRLPGRGR